MGLLDVATPQLASSQASFTEQAGQFRSTISSAESEAMQSQAFHQGESAVAFQGAHARFVEAAQKINMLLDTASSHLGEGSATYLAQDGAAANSIASATGALPS